MRTVCYLSLALAFVAPIATAQTPAASAADRVLILALADSALAAINRGNMVALTDLIVEDGIIGSVSVRDSTTRHSMRTRAAERARQPRGTIVERGFRPEVRISGPLATVWLPYDLYIEGNWSHCGVDTFTMMKTPAGWRIATLVWSIEQPPACERHPDGPPKR